MRCIKRNINWEVYSDKCLHLKRKKNLKWKAWLHLKNWKKNDVSRREEIVKTKVEVNKIKNRRIYKTELFFKHKIIENNLEKTEIKSEMKTETLQLIL